MFFAASKLFWMLAQPLNALCALGLLGFVVRLRWDMAGQRMINIALAGILVLGLLPVGPFALTYIETRYPVPRLPEKIDGIIMLGGAFEAQTSKMTGQIVANDSVERGLCFVDLAKKNPDAQLVFSGGSGDILHPDAIEAETVKEFYTLSGIGERDVIYEKKSRNTYENVLYSMERVDPKNTENWIVITSAYHMPRTMGIFKQFGWRVIPYPCDRRTDGTYNLLSRLPNIAGNFEALNIVVKEIAGSIVYYLTDKSAFILPPSSDRMGS